MENKHKLDVLSQAAERFNAQGIIWAVGGSLLLYLKKIADSFHDIDIMVKKEDAESAKRILCDMGELRPPKSDEKYKTQHFYEFLIDGVDVDVMGGFTIVKDHEEYDCSLSQDSISEFVDVNGQRIPLQAVSDWRRYYALMGRDAKVAMIDRASIQ